MTIHRMQFDERSFQCLRHTTKLSTLRISIKKLSQYHYQILNTEYVLCQRYTFRVGQPSKFLIVYDHAGRQSEIWCLCLLQHVRDTFITVNTTEKTLPVLVCMLYQKLTFSRLLQYQNKRQFFLWPVFGLNTFTMQEHSLPIFETKRIKKFISFLKMPSNSNSNSKCHNTTTTSHPDWFY